MFRRILCPVDGTVHSGLALKRAVELSGRFGADLTICTVNAGHAAAESAPWDDGTAGVILEKAASLSRTMGHAGAATELVIAREVAPAILQLAEIGRFDCIVMGTGEWRGVSKTDLGSVATDVSRRAHCSVMVAR